MRYRPLGKARTQVSEIGLGCEHLQGKDYATVLAVIDEALANNINIFDVFMSEPQVRTDIGRALAGRRDKVIIQGHIGATWQDGQYARSRDRKACEAFFNDLLSRLQTDYIDIGMLHYVDTEEDFAGVFDTEIIRYAVALKEKGTIGLIGLSAHNPVIAKRAVETGLIDVLMFSVNPAYDLLPEHLPIDDMFSPDMLDKHTENGLHPARAALYSACEKMGCAITVMKGYCAGMLLDGTRSPFGFPLTTAQCIHYALTRPAVASILVGCTTPEQVRLACAYEMADDAEKDFSGVLAAKPRYAVSGSCVYCNHCLPCAAKIDIAQVNKYLDMAGETPPPTIAAHYQALTAHGGDCIACGQCEPNCPFGVPIMARMAKAKAAFGR